MIHEQGLPHASDFLSKSRSETMMKLGTATSKGINFQLIQWLMNIDQLIVN